MIANAARGEAAWTIGGTAHILRPSFAALVAAEGDIGPLFAFVERAAEGRASLDEIAALFWHCIDDRPPTLTHAAVGASLIDGGLMAATPVLRALLMQIMQGA
ncbi:MAG: hypothetical protein RLZZ58_1909 [Pseudomonadota bacterium]|jgi:hypothetical protein